MHIELIFAEAFQIKCPASGGVCHEYSPLVSSQNRLRRRFHGASLLRGLEIPPADLVRIRTTWLRATMAGKVHSVQIARELSRHFKVECCILARVLRCIIL